jgi:hypothetical protein
MSILEIGDVWRQKQETAVKYPDVSNMAYNKLSIIPYGVQGKFSSSLGIILIRWRQSETTGENPCEKVVTRQSA